MCRNTPSAMRGEGRASHDGFGLSFGNAGVDMANRRPRSSAISGSNWLRGRQGIVRSIRAITGVRPKASLADARPLRLRDRDRISELMCQKCPFSGLQERLVWVEGLVVVKRTHRERTSPVSNSLLTPAEASGQLGLTPGALAQLRYTGGGPRFIKLTARAVRYRQCDLDAWIAAKARTSTRDVGVAR